MDCTTNSVKVGDTNSSVGDPMGQTVQNWLKEASNHGAGYFTQNMTGIAKGSRETHAISTANSKAKSAVMRMSAEGGVGTGGRPSVMSESLTGSNIMAPRIPYRRSVGDHNLNKS